MDSSILTDLDFASATNAAATVLYQKNPTQSHKIQGGFAWSYSDTPTGGKVSVEVNDEVVFELDITSAGPGFIPFWKEAKKDQKLEVILAAGGAGIVGKLNVLGHIES